ncbi:mediator complex subunit 13 C-terminal-domain-containing protein [Limtongia smithiae]|uniref:mediator complex subunit 13 C-terminal-domain-containing protein n=1 Tax=Limtongia smithiae TaxID=1125753 RepID=UPI0034D002B8
MTTPPDKYYSNVFQLGAFDQIRYSVYVDPLCRPLKMLMAEWSLRQKQKTFLVSCHGQELWTFSLTTDLNPAVPDHTFGLKEISTGTFLPSTLSAADTVAPQSFSAPYVPLMLAIASLISRNLTTDYDYIPLGSILLSPTQTVLHFTLRLLSSGILLLTPRCQMTRITRISSIEEDYQPDMHVVLAPSGTHAIAEGKAKGIPRDASAIMSNIFLSSGIRVLNENSWTSVTIIGTTSSFAWPSELCFISLPRPESSTSDIDWFNMGDPLEDIENFFVSFCRGSQYVHPSGDNDGSKGGMAMSNRKSLTAVYPTPPDPQAQARPTKPPNRLNWEDGGTEQSDFLLTDQWGTVDSTRLPNEGSELVEDDRLLLGDAEVTEADFNFFDNDSPSSRRFIGKEPSDTLNFDETADDLLNGDIQTFDIDEMMEILPIPKSVKADPSEPSGGLVSHKIMTPPLSPLKIVSRRNVGIMPRKRKSVFTPILFHPNLESALDTKYVNGGRFYAPDDVSNSSESEQDEQEDYESYQDFQDQRAPGLERGESKRARDSPAEDLSSEAYISRQAWWMVLTQMLTPRGELLADLNSFDSPLSSLFVRKYEDASRSDVEHILQTLCESIVWDDALLESYLPPNPIPSVCGADFVNVVKSTFGPIQALLLEKLTEVSDSTTRGLLDESEQDILESEQLRSNGDEALRSFGFETGIFNDEIFQPEQVSSQTKSTKLRQHDIFHIPPPRISVMRMNGALEVLPPALRFWHTFGFSPQSDRKNAVSFLVYPGSPGMSSAAASLLDRIKPVYEGSGLGNFVLGEVGDFKNGLVPVPGQGTGMAEALENVTRTCDLLGQLLVDFVDESPNIVIFIVLAYTDPSSLLQIGQSIYDLKQEYVQRMAESIETAGANLIFQLIPALFFAARDTIAMPSQFDLVKFALSIYDKCLPANEPYEDNAIFRKHFPAYTLARIPPSRLNFKLTSAPTASLFNEIGFVHVAYSRSRDRRFVTAAWSDQYGELARTALFLCIKKDGARPRSIEDVFTEIWERTLNLLPKLTMSWKLVFAKIGSMDQSELNIWTTLASHCPRDVNAIFVSLELNPTLSVLETSESALAGDYHIMPTPESSSDPRDTQSYVSTTSLSDVGNGINVSTLNGGVTATFVQGFGSTTAGGVAASSTSVLDQDATLVDLKDETYGIILNHKLQLDQYDIACRRFSLISGYLIKPGTEGLLMSILQVSLLSCPKPWEPMLEELLKQYRGLACFGSLSGVYDSRNGITPWHVTAVEKMQRLLSSIL